MGCAVVLTQPNRERLAAERVGLLGFDVWLPVTDVVRYGRHFREPLFPRYMFVWITGAWHALLGTVGVANVLRNGDYPAFVPDHTSAGTGILDLRARERGGVIVLPPSERFLPGEGVHVDEGLFAGQCGLYDGMTGPARCRVLFEAMGQCIPVELREADLSAA